MSIRYYKDKAYFTMNMKGHCIMARTACIILKYTKKNLKDESFILSIKEKKDFVELPGGKVEVGDLDIYDTMFRELWEEIILKDQLGEGNHKHLKNWAAIRDTIVNSKDVDEQLCYHIYNALKTAPVVSYGGVLKTVYFVVNITDEQAEHFIQKHNAIPIGIDVIEHIIESNKPKSWGRNALKNKTYKGKNTYLHIMDFSKTKTSDGIYRIRGRDFDGLSRVMHLL